MSALEQAARRKKDPYWWMHPAFKGRQALALEDLSATADDAFMWTKFDDSLTDPDSVASDAIENGIPIGQGKFKEFAQLLFKMNDCRPGPVKNWYVVVCIEENARWAVGQLRADPITPVQIFEDLIFDEEDKARDFAASLKR